MFGTQTNGGIGGTDAYEREKIRILQALNVQVNINIFYLQYYCLNNHFQIYIYLQVQTMAMKLDQIVTQVEEVNNNKHTF